MPEAGTYHSGVRDKCFSGSLLREFFNLARMSKIYSIMFTAFYLILVLFLVLANGFFVASEFAFVGVRRSRIETLAAEREQ